MIRPISSEDLAKLAAGDWVDPELAKGTVHLYDVRTADEFVAGHVAGARHVPVDQAKRWIPQRNTPTEMIVLVDENGARGGPARTVAGKLAHQWFRRLFYLAGGMAQWREEERPTEQGGPAGEAAASFEGTQEEFHLSSDARWRTPDAPLTPDPSR